MLDDAAPGAAARVVKKLGPEPLRRALSEGLAPRPVAPVRLHAAPLAVGAALVLATGALTTCESRPLPKLAEATPYVSRDAFELVRWLSKEPPPPRGPDIPPRIEPVAGARLPPRFVRPGGGAPPPSTPRAPGDQGPVATFAFGEGRR